MKYLLTLIILTTAAASVMACSVIPSSFCYEADRAPDEVIVSGTITGVDADGIDFEIRDVIRGTESRAVIRIWDGTDGYCNGVISMAADEIGAVGESFVLLLPVIDSLENTWDVLGDYRRPNWFGPTTALPIEDEKVEGYIKGYNDNPWPTDEITVTYQEFFDAWANDGDCQSIEVILGSSTESHVIIEAQVTNPISDAIDIAMVGNSTSRLFNLYSITGELLHSVRSPEQYVSIPTPDLPKGLLILTISSAGSRPFVAKVTKI